MYCNFFGFSENPFDVTPDPRFLYLSPSHREALEGLMYGIRERKGFITMMGEVGTGKTTLLNALLEGMDEKMKLAFIMNTDATFEEMLLMGLIDLGLAMRGESLSKVDAMDRLYEYGIKQLAEGNTVAFVVDESQNLDTDCLENLRLLSNLETPQHKLIQIVMSGQPGLEVKLSQPDLRQLAQRISLRRTIRPLNEKETYQYMYHRLRVVGYNGPALFSRRAFQLIWKHSRGVPRNINMICDNALLIAYATRMKTIQADAALEALKDLSWSPSTGPQKNQETVSGGPVFHAEPEKPRFRYAMVAILVLIACLVAFLYFRTKRFPSEVRKIEKRALDAIKSGHHPSTLEKGSLAAPSRQVANLLKEAANEAEVSKTAAKEVEPQAGTTNGQGAGESEQVGPQEGPQTQAPAAPPEVSPGEEPGPTEEEEGEPEPGLDENAPPQE